MIFIKNKFAELILTTLAVSVMAIAFYSAKKSEQPAIVTDSLTIELEKTRARYKIFKRDQAKKDSITHMKVEMGEIEETTDEFIQRTRREILEEYKSYYRNLRK